MQSGAIPSFDALPDSGYARQRQLIRSCDRPELPAPLPFSATTLWRKVREGTFPAPIKLGPKTTAWKVGDVRQWLFEQEKAAQCQ